MLPYFSYIFYFTKYLSENLENTTEYDKEISVNFVYVKIFQLTVIIVDKFSNFFKIFAKMKLTNVLYCLLLRFPNFQKDTLYIQKVI